MDPSSIKKKAKSAIGQKKADGIADVKNAKKQGEASVKAAGKAKSAAVDSAKSNIKAAGDKAAGEIKAVGKNAVAEIENAKAAVDAIKNAPAQMMADAAEIAQAVEDAVGEVAGAVQEAVDAIAAALGFGAPAKPSKEPAGGSRPFDHRGNFRFRVEVGGIDAGRFKAVDGLATTTELIEYQGGGDMYARQIPGRPKIAPITLKKGYIASNELWSWMQDTMEGKFAFHNVSVVLMDDDGQTDLVRYELVQCWPSSWKGFQLDGMGNEAMVEELELQVRTMNRGKA